MNQMLNNAVAEIEKQQPEERTAVWMVGEQLKDMLRGNPQYAELVLQDLTTGGMTLAGCEKGIKAVADKRKKNGFFCVTPLEAEEVIRKYFGLPERDEETRPTATPKSEGIISLDEFF